MAESEDLPPRPTRLDEEVHDELNRELHAGLEALNQRLPVAPQSNDSDSHSLGGSTSDLSDSDAPRYHLETPFAPGPQGKDHPAWTTADTVEEWANRVAWVSGLGMVASMVLGLGAPGFAISSTLLLVSVVIYRVASSTAESPEGTLRSGLTERALSLWDHEAASFYGLLSLSRFIYLEVQTFLAEYAQADGFLDFITSELFEVVIGFSAASLQNFISAAIWPFMLFGQYGLTAIAGLGVGYLVWDRFHDWVDKLLGRNQTPDPLLTAPSDD